MVSLQMGQEIERDTKMVFRKMVSRRITFEYGSGSLNKRRNRKKKKIL